MRFVGIAFRHLRESVEICECVISGNMTFTSASKWFFSVAASYLGIMLSPGEITKEQHGALRCRRGVLAYLINAKNSSSVEFGDLRLTAASNDAAQLKVPITTTTIYLSTYEVSNRQDGAILCNCWSPSRLPCGRCNPFLPARRTCSIFAKAN